MNYKVYTSKNIHDHVCWSKLSDSQKEEVKIVSKVLPFRTNNYVLDSLIDWNNFEKDPMFILNFPQKEMIGKAVFEELRSLVRSDASKVTIRAKISEIRKGLNPQPGNQHDNVPEMNGVKLPGLQHKYKETVLFFPKKGQACHAYCTFCFRWAQFINDKDLAFSSKDYERLVDYIKAKPDVTDLLITGGDPMVMNAKSFGELIDVILARKPKHLKTIRIGTKSLTYWPYKYVSDHDADNILKIFKRIVDSGIHLSFMAHFNHPVEMGTKIFKEAVKRIQGTGAIIRTQSPLLRHINDDASVWLNMWRKQVRFGMVPYYMFIARDTGAHNYFGVSLEKALEIYQNAYKKVSGIARTVRGPVMSAEPGKVQLTGILGKAEECSYVMQFIQGRDPEWVGKPFLVKRNPEAMWLSDLVPADENEPFFFQ